MPVFFLIWLVIEGSLVCFNYDRLIKNKRIHIILLASIIVIVDLFYSENHTLPIFHPLIGHFIPEETGKGRNGKTTSVERTLFQSPHGTYGTKETQSDIPSSYCEYLSWNDPSFLLLYPASSYLYFNLDSNITLDYSTRDLDLTNSVLVYLISPSFGAAGYFLLTSSASWKNVLSEFWLFYKVHPVDIR